MTSYQKIKGILVSQFMTPLNAIYKSKMLNVDYKNKTTQQLNDLSVTPLSFQQLFQSLF